MVALASALAACGDEDRPPVSESAPLSSLQLGGSGASAAPSDPSADGDPEITEPVAEPGPCEPRSYRQCKIFYRDDTGQLQCPVKVQICDVDGAEWLPCGEYTYDENGDPQKVH